MTHAAARRLNMLGLIVLFRSWLDKSAGVARPCAWLTHPSDRPCGDLETVPRLQCRSNAWSPSLASTGNWLFWRAGFGIARRLTGPAEWMRASYR